MASELPDWFCTAAETALDMLGPAAVGEIGAAMLAGTSPDAIVAEFPLPTQAKAASALAVVMEDGATSWDAAGSYLLGSADGFRRGRERQSVSIVWSGPTSVRVPVRSTQQVILEVVGAAHSELLLTTYSAKPYEPLLEALAAAVARGVKVSVLVETLQGAGSAIQGAEPAAAFTGLPGVELWHWPARQRPDGGAKMHAKIAVADRRILFTTSANLTSSGVERNMEAGVLIQGGSEPGRAAEHVRELQIAGVLARYH
jgi:phosphatidylserine/phosphatidylglycerophosphate/cardiolipin synthase-like enzyme